jgi:hypothetical protein
MAHEDEGGALFSVVDLMSCITVEIKPSYTVDCYYVFI